ncbi:hypothetical protein MMC22_009407 [Lobaria immixta]|nr:hypothetical protein [Lobaria immixta]
MISHPYQVVSNDRVMNNNSRYPPIPARNDSDRAMNNDSRYNPIHAQNDRECAMNNYSRPDPTQARKDRERALNNYSRHNPPQARKDSEHRPLRNSNATRDFPNKIENHGEPVQPLRNQKKVPSMISSTLGRARNTLVKHLFRSSQALEDISPRFSNLLKASTMAPEEPSEATNSLQSPISPVAAPEPLPSRGESFEQRAESLSPPRRKNVTSSGATNILQSQIPPIAAPEPLGKSFKQRVERLSLPQRKNVPSSETTNILQSPIPPIAAPEPLGEPFELRTERSAPPGRKNVTSSEATSILQSPIPPIADPEPLGKSFKQRVERLSLPQRKNVPSSEATNILQSPIPATAAPEPLGKSFRQRAERLSLPQRKTVTFSPNLEILPARSPSPDSNSGDGLLVRTYTSSRSIPRRKPVPINPPLQAAQARVKSFVESEGYRQYVTDQHLIQSTSKPEDLQSQPSVQGPSIIPPTDYRGSHRERPTRYSTPQTKIPQHSPHADFSYANTPREQFSASCISASSHKAPQPGPVAPLAWDSSIKVELPGEESIYGTEATNSAPNVTTQDSSESYSSTEELSVTRPKSYPQTSSVPRGLRRTPKSRSVQPDLRQIFCIRAEFQNALTSSSRHSSPGFTRLDGGAKQHFEKVNQDPEDWYPPSKYRPWQWKTADAILNRTSSMDKVWKPKESIEKLIGHSRLLFRKG